MPFVIMEMWASSIPDSHSLAGRQKLGEVVESGPFPLEVMAPPQLDSIGTAAVRSL